MVAENLDVYDSTPENGVNDNCYNEVTSRQSHSDHRLLEDSDHRHVEDSDHRLLNNGDHRHVEDTIHDIVAQGEICSLAKLPIPQENTWLVFHDHFNK